MAADELLVQALLTITAEEEAFLEQDSCELFPMLAGGRGGTSCFPLPSAKGGSPCLPQKWCLIVTDREPSPYVQLLP